MNPPFRGTLALLALPLLLSASLAASNPLQNELKSRWVGKTFILRGFPSDHLIRTDAAGKPLVPLHQGPWTLASVKIRDLKVSKRGIEIAGDRFVLTYDAPKRRWQAILPKYDELAVRIQVQADPAQIDAAALQHGLFYTDYVESVHARAEFWRDFSNNTPPPPINADVLPKGSQPPLSRHAPDPDYTDLTRELKIQGRVTLHVQITAAGTISAIQISEPLGAGLDEQAVDTIRKWTFTPAHDPAGRAIPVPAEVQINFRLRH